MTRPVSIVLLTMVVCTAPCGAAHTQPSVTANVLLIHWSAEDSPGSAGVEAAIRRSLNQSGRTFQLFTEHLEGDRFPADVASSSLRDYIRAKYVGKTIDVVLAPSIAALQFVLRYRHELFPAAPVVFSGFAALAATERSPVRGVTGIISGPGLHETVEMARRLHPSAKRAFVIAESPGTPLREMVRDELQDVPPPLEIAFMTEESVPRLIAALADLPRDSFVLFVRHPHGSAGNPMRLVDVARMVADASSVPVYGITDEVIGSGIVGGVVYRISSIGMRMGEMTADLLRGKRIEDVPIERAGHVPMFDWRQVERWQIPQARLPQGRIVQFQRESFFQIYRHYVAAGLVIFLAQLSLIGSLLIQRVKRRRAEEDTRTNEARYRSVVDTQSEMICRFLPDSTLTFVNDAYCRFWNKTREELLGHKFIELIPPSARQPVLERVGRLQSGMDSNEHPVLTADGGIGWQHWINHAIADTNGCVVEIQGVGRDITDRKRAEEALSRVEARNTAILRAIPDLMFLLSKDGVYLDYYAPDTSELLLQPDQFLGRPMRDVLPPESTRSFEDGFARLMAGETPVIIDYQLKMPDGERHYEARMVSCGSDQVLAIVRDTTEAKRAEHALHQTQADLARVSRLTALGEFAASIAHEVRQPLTAVMLNAKASLRWMTAAAPDLESIRAALADVLAAAQRADNVISRNRELFKDHTVRKVPTDLNSVIREVKVLVAQRLHAGGVTLTSETPDALPLVNADRVEIQQVLLNLISNSIDAMESVDRASRRISISTSVDADGMLTVAVKDAGVGLAGVDVPRMFSLSYTTKPRGSGVGLSISRAIIDAHGGRLWAQQNAGPGATFFFTIPIHSSEAAA
jgi:PAS domain S-box-containing protein